MKEGMGQLCYYYKTIYRHEGRDGSNMCFIIIKLRFSSLRYM